MNWLTQLQTTQPIAHGVIILCGVAALGLAIGNLKIRGFSLGIAGTLFAGILFGHFGLDMETHVRHFIQEFGLILFVYTIGMQVGPRFLGTLRQQGLPLNLLAAGNVLLGAATMAGLCLLLGVGIDVGVGIFSGATTNTPALGAAQEALRTVTETAAISDRVALPALGYAVAYPFGVIGIILAMILIRKLYRMNVNQERNDFRIAQRAGQENLTRLSIEVVNPNLDGIQLRSIPGMSRSGVVVSRYKRAGTRETALAKADTILRVGDILLAVGKTSDLESFRLIVGKVSAEDLVQAPGPLTYRRVVVTHKDIVGKSLRELALNERHGVTLTRITRGDLEMGVTADLSLQFGDVVQIVGVEKDIDKIAELLGNSVAELNHAKLVPMFVGIALGVIVGLIPFHVSGMPAPLRLGLAGGPLLVAILLGHIGRIGPMLWFMPVNANNLLREFGIVLFLSCVGLRAGGNFVHTLMNGDGFLWMGIGAAITFAPLLLIGFLARTILKMNFMNICGLLSGSMTDPPALAFANTYSGSDAPAVAYATVYPLTMLLRILTAQLLVLIFC